MPYGCTVGVRSACRSGGQDEVSDGVVEHLEFAHGRVIAVCEHQRTSGPAHGVLCCLAGVQGQRLLIIGGLAGLGFSEGGDGDAELLDKRFEVSQTRLLCGRNAR